MSDIHDRIAELAQRIRIEMLGGLTLDDVLRALKREEYNSVMVVAAVRALGNMGLATAKDIVSTWCEGRSYAHLTVADLELLGDAPHVAGVEFFTRMDRDRAIIDRKPWILVARKSKQSVYTIASRVPLAALPSPLADGQYGSRSGASVSFESVAAELRTAAAAWPTEIAIERDEPDELLVHFVRART